jgi:hypothetical protein
MKNVLLFDLGNTLANYYDVHDFPAILKQAIIGVEDYLSQNGLLHVSEDNLWHRVREEDHESKDYRVRRSKNGWREFSNLTICPTSAGLQLLCVGVSSSPYLPEVIAMKTPCQLSRN